MDIVLKLRELRRLHRLSQKEVALSAGIGEKTLSSFETGERLPSMKLVQLLSLLTVYETTPAEFFGGKVETDVFCELERVSPNEAKVIGGLRELPPALRVRLEEKFVSMIEAMDAVAPPARL